MSSRPPPDFGDAVSTDFVKGLARVAEKMVILLDIDNLVHFDDTDGLGAPGNFGGSAAAVPSARQASPACGGTGIAGDMWRGSRAGREP